MFFLRFILLVILFSLVINLIRRIFFSFGSHRFTGNANNYDNGRVRHEGDVIVEREDRNRKKKIGKDVGEYVKYEEVDED